MLKCECSRCGKETPWVEAIAIHIIPAPIENSPVEYLFLCENCYQTIKEVLEDGEIK